MVLRTCHHVAVGKSEPSAHRWQRLERRVSSMPSMLLRAVPEAQKEELVAGKNLSAFAIMAHLQILYQPGGLGEKETILRNLESPPEAANLHEGASQLRRWIRWRVRARDIGVAEPDPSVLVRGLQRISKKVLEVNSELRFRVSLARSTLMLDSAPTAQSVERYVTLLLAEMEQIAHTEKAEKKSNPPRPKLNEARVSKEGKGENEKGGKGKGKFGGDSKGAPCHYFLTDEGCRRGRDCGFAHVMDSEKRCWACGSKSHFAGSCPRGSSDAKEAKEGGGQKAIKQCRRVTETPRCPARTGMQRLRKGVTSVIRRQLQAAAQFKANRRRMMV